MLLIDISVFAYNNSSVHANSPETSIEWVILFTLFILQYIIFSVGLYQLGVKMRYSRNWLAFIPILRIGMIFELANISPWYLLVLFIPITGGLTFYILIIIAFRRIAIRNQKSGILGLLVMIPIINLFVPFWVAPKLQKSDA